MNRKLSIVVVFASSLWGGCGDPCGACDADTELCLATTACGYFHAGVPNPLGGVGSAQCEPLPESCIDADTCECRPGFECAREDGMFRIEVQCD